MRPWSYLAAILTVAAVLAPLDCAAQPHRLIDSGSGHVVIGVAAAIGGPKGVRGSAGLRFPLVPAGALAAAPAFAPAHRAASGRTTVMSGGRQAVSSIGGAAASPRRPAGLMRTSEIPALHKTLGSHAAALHNRGDASSVKRRPAGKARHAANSASIPARKE